MNDLTKEEQELKKSELSFRNIIESNNDIVFEIGIDGTIKYLSPAIKNYFNRSPEELVGQNFLQFVYPEDRPFLVDIFENNRFGEFKYIEYRLFNPETGIRWVQASAKTILDEDDRPVKRSGIIRDITDLKITENALKKSEEKYRKLIESINDTIYEVDTSGNLLFVSQSVSRVLGYSQEEVLGRNIFEFIYPADIPQVKEALKNLSSRNYEFMEYRYVKKDGGVNWVRSSTTPVFENGIFIGGNGVLTDITDRKLAEEKLRQNEEKYRKLVESINDVIYDITSEGIIKYLSPSIEKITGYTANELIGNNFIPYVHPEDLSLMSVRLDNKSILPVDFRFIAKDGCAVWVRSLPSPLFEDEKFVGRSGILSDITAQKKAELELMHSEELYRSIITASPDCITITDLEGRIEFSSPGSLELFGFNSSNDYLGHFVMEFIDPVDQARAIENFRRIATEGVETIEYKARKNNGELYIEVSPEVIRDHLGNPSKILMVSRDVTEKRRIVQKLRDSEESFRNMVENINDVVYEVSAQGIITYVSPSIERILGYLPKSVIGTSFFEYMHPEDRPVLMKALENLGQVDFSYLEYRYLTKSGDICWVRSSTKAIIQDGKVMGGRGVLFDINDRKKTEQEIQELNANLELKIKERTNELGETNLVLLKEIEVRTLAEKALAASEEKYRSVVENIKEVIFITDAAGNWKFLNKAWEEITGFTVEDSLDTLFVNYVHPDDRERNWKLFEPLINREKEYCRHEIRYLTKTGGFRWIEVYARLGLDENGNPTGTYGTLQDITERKLAEEQLHWSQSLLQSMSNSSPMGFLVVDNRTDDILYFNDRFCQIWEIEHLTEKMKNGELKNNDIIPYCLPILADVQAFDESCKPLQSSENRDVIEDEIAVAGNRTIRRYSTQIRGGNDEYFGRFYIFEDITQRKHAEDLENELLQLSPKLTGVKAENIENAINMTITQVGEFLSADRAYIFEIDKGNDTISNTYEWCNKNIEPQIELLQSIPVTTIPKWMEKLNNHDNIVINSVEDWPESWQAERGILEPQGIQSLIVIPLLTENKLMGFVGLNDIRRKRVYNTREINIITVWSSILASLINNRRTESLIEQTRQNYQTFFNTIDDFLLILDLKGRIIHANETVYRRLGYSPEEILNKTVLNLRPLERYQEAKEVFKRILKKEIDFCSIPFLAKSGLQIPVETRFKYGKWDGEPRIFMVSKDISQIKLSEEKFSAAFQSSSAMMTISKVMDEKLIDVNNAFVNLLGCTREESIGKSISDLELLLNPEIHREILEEIKQNSKVREREILMQTKNKSIKTVLLSADPILVGDQRCILKVMVDITERKKTEDDLRTARLEAEKANQAKSEFLSRMSHELRTPMNSILGFAQLLEMGGLNNSQTRGVHHILKSGRHLLDLINEVLEISRIEAGRLSLSIESVQLSIIIPEMLDILRPVAEEKHISINIVSKSENHLFVKADRQRLKQILLNLINNAIKYSNSEGLVSVSIDIQEPINNETTFIRISVTDNGIGIREEDILKLFNPFERIGAERTGTEGTGLGLNVVKKLIEAMGGRLGVESQIGTGSTFWVELPKSDSQKEVMEKSGQFSMLKTDENFSGKILYVEDNPSNVELVEQVISSKRNGIQMTTTSNGLNAVEIASLQKPDLILLDLNLPDIHGSKVLENLLQNNDTKDIPVVIISADAMPQQLRSMLQAGAKEYLTKPLDILDLLKVIDKYISAKPE